MMHLDPLTLARIQFGFTVSFHIVFPAVTIGMASRILGAKMGALFRL